MHNQQWESLKFTDNPFTIEPDYSRSSNLIWADMKDVRRKFVSILTHAFSTEDKQVVLNFGEWGGGKTHAAHFFTNTRNFPDIPNVSCLPVVVRLPKEPEKGDASLYRNILETIGFLEISSTIRKILEIADDQTLLSHLAQITNSEDLAKAIVMLGHNSNPGRLFQMDEEQPSLTIRSYFLENSSTRKELKSLGLARNIKSVEDRFGVLAAIIHLLAGPSIIRDSIPPRRVILWIDEMEDLILYPVKYYRPFTQAIRDLISRLPRNFTLMMNFTLISPEAIKDIEIVLSPALLSRVTDKIEFKNLTPEEARVYVMEILHHYRIPNYEGSVLHPFTEDGLIKALNAIPAEQMTPREINKRCHHLLASLFQREDSLIDAAYVGQIDLNDATGV